jgi:hypothetical protein
MVDVCRFTTAQSTARAVPIIRIGRQESIVVGGTTRNLKSGVLSSLQLAQLTEAPIEH